MSANTPLAGWYVALTPIVIDHPERVRLVLNELSTVGGPYFYDLVYPVGIHEAHLLTKLASGDLVGFKSHDEALSYLMSLPNPDLAEMVAAEGDDPPTLGDDDFPTLDDV